MKKFLALILALLMVLSLAACGGNGDDTTKDTGKDTSSNDTSSNDTTEDTSGPADAEELPAAPLYYNGFETTDGLTAVHRVDKSESPEADAANYGIAPSVHEIMQVNGVDGKALAVDGKYGVSFNDFPTTSDDSYTIAFWYAADRYGLYMPILQMGRNVGGTTNSTYINFTRTNWGVGGVDCAPIAWSRNSDTNPSNPWIGNNVDERGKKEWIHVVLVVDGVEYMDADAVNGPCPHVGATLYVNGVEVMKADASVIGTKDEAGTDTSANWMGIAPHMLDSEGAYGLECYFGINYWDSLFKGYMDEFYVYDEALTPGQVTTLYTKFTAPAYEKFPDYTGPLDDEGEEAPTTEAIDPATLTAAPVDETAIDTLGTPDRVLGWWTDNSASYPVEEGKTTTLTLKNYSNATANWCNFCLGLCANEFTTEDFVSGDATVCTVEGYTEYAVQRTDAYGWAPEGSVNYAATYTMSWTDWVDWLNKMTDVDVTVALTRAANVVTIDYTFTAADGSVMTEQAVVTTDAPADGPIYVFVEGEGAYIELLSAVTE